MQAAAGNIYPMIGIMTMPASFKYRDVIKKGRPVHKKFDDFWRKHPPMSPSRWAKIFSPFDALEGFDERIAEKEVLYEMQAELNEDDRTELDRRLAILRDLNRNRRMARENRIIVSVSCFVPCTDQNHSAYGTGGQYETVTGMVIRVERDRIILETEYYEQTIPFNVIREITCESGIFDLDYM